MENDKIIKGLKFHYTDNGDGPRTIVLMHGWGCDHSTLATVERTALECGLRAVNVDFPGFGGSDEPGEVWGVEEYTQAVERLLDELGVSNPILLGHSFGGRVGILYASRHPEVEKLILVDAAGVKPRRSFNYYRKVYSFKLLKYVMYLSMGRKEAEHRLDQRRAKAGSADYAKASPMMRRILSKVVNEDLRSVMPGIKAPTLLVWGKNDTATPMRDAEIMEKLIPNAGLVAFDGAGHYSFLDNMQGFQAVLKNFLN